MSADVNVDVKQQETNELVVLSCNFSEEVPLKLETDLFFG